MILTLSQCFMWGNWSPESVQVRLHSAWIAERGKEREQPDIRTLTVQLKFILAPWNWSPYSWWRGIGLISLLWSIQAEESGWLISRLLKTKSNLERVHCPLLLWRLNTYFFLSSLIWITTQNPPSLSCHRFVLIHLKKRHQNRLTQIL